MNKLIIKSLSWSTVYWCFFLLPFSLTDHSITSSPNSDPFSDFSSCFPFLFFLAKITGSYGPSLTQPGTLHPWTVLRCGPANPASFLHPISGDEVMFMKKACVVLGMGSRCPHLRGGNKKLGQPGSLSLKCKSKLQWAITSHQSEWPS